MKLVYTTCSLGYLWQTAALANSFLAHNPDYHFIVCIIDRKPNDLDLQKYNLNFEVHWVEDLGIPEFFKLVEYYDIFSILMAIKGIVLEVFLQKYNPDFIIYLDTDILVFNKFDWLEQEMSNYDIFITPHCRIPFSYETPLEQVTISLPANAPFEDRVFLLTGIYNAGFVAVKNSEQGRGFAAWWASKLKNQCFASHYTGLFYDQIWLNFVPLYFSKTCVVNHLGYNVAFWSFHERSITEKNEIFYINEKFPLVFFHYTGYRHSQPHLVSEWTNITFEEQPILKKIFEPYAKLIEGELYKDLHHIRCAYIDMHAEMVKRKKVVIKEALSFRILRKLLSFLPSTLRQQLKNALA